MECGTENRPRVALATCGELPDLDEDGKLLIGALRELGIEAVPAIWDRADEDWSQYDLVVVRTCWDYVQKYAAFLEWSNRVPRLCNPAALIGWNANKTYLADLETCGIPIIPTKWVEARDRCEIPTSGQWVVKPAISIASMDAGRYDLACSGERQLMQGHLRRLHASGRVALVQPYMSEIDSRGETSLVFFDGIFRHAIKKAAMLQGPDDGIDRRFLPAGGQRREPVAPSAEELELGQLVLSKISEGIGPPLYARVDLTASRVGPVLMELELIEPQLYLQETAAHGDFAKRIVARLHGAGSSANAAYRSKCSAIDFTPATISSGLRAA